MNPVLEANQVSDLSKHLTKEIPSSNPFGYFLQENFANVTKVRQVVEPDLAPSGTTYGSTVNFRIPRTGILYKAVLESTLSTSGNNSAIEEGLGARVFSLIQLRTTAGQKHLCSQTSDYVQARIDSLPSQENSAINALVAPSSVFNANAVTCYTPLFFSCFEASGQTLCTKFLEDLNVVASVNSESGMGLLAPLTSATYRLHCYFVALEEEDYNSYIEMQFSKPITQLWYDIWPEPVQSLNATDTSVSFASEFDGLVFASHFLLKDAQTAALSVIESISIEALGLKHIETNSLLNSIDTGLLRIGDSGSDVLDILSGSKICVVLLGS